MEKTGCLFARLRANLAALVRKCRNTGNQFVVKAGENKETGCAGAAAIKEPDGSVFGTLIPFSQKSFDKIRAKNHKRWDLFVEQKQNM